MAASPQASAPTPTSTPTAACRFVVEHFLPLDDRRHELPFRLAGSDFGAHRPGSGCSARAGALSSGGSASRGGQRRFVSYSQATWPALGTTVHLVVGAAGDLEAIREIVEGELGRIDRACSRFRPDAELVGLNSAGGQATRVSALLFEAIDVALSAARVTEGAVDPTVGAAMVAAGYDRDFEALAQDGSPVSPVPAPGWRAVEMDAPSGTVRLRRGAQLDLGATAKALAADRAARLTRSVTDVGVLLSLGGDIAVAGPPPSGGWPVALADDHRSSPTGPVVRLRGGGLATSSTSVRRWRRSGRELTHILDPLTGAPCGAVWRTVSVKAASCVEANVASTATIVLGRRGPRWLTRAGLEARLVGVDGCVVYLNGWPVTDPA